MARNQGQQQCRRENRPTYRQPEVGRCSEGSQKHPGGDCAKSEAGSGAEQGEQKVLRHQLAQHTSAARADRHADIDLAPPHQSARQQHVPQVGAGGNQHQQDHYDEGRDRG